MTTPKVGDIQEGFVFVGGDPHTDAAWKKLPQVGEVQDGFVFKGGNPTEDSSWEKAGDKVEDVSSPEISTLDRLAVKNFGIDNAQSVEYLKKQYPQLDIKEEGGEIIAKKQGEKTYKKLDPSGFLAGEGILGKISELAKDIGDIGYDVASGVGTGAAATAAGLPSGGVGAVPAGIAAGVAGESLRQQIGKALGLGKEGSTSDVILSGAIGGVVPAAGAAVKGLYKGAKSAAKVGLEAAIGDEKVAKKLFEIASKTAPEEVKNAKLNNTILDVADDIYNKVKSVKSNAQASYDEVTKIADESGILADIRPIKESLDVAINEVSTLEGGGSDDLKKELVSFSNKLLKPFKPEGDKSALVDQFGNPVEVFTKDEGLKSDTYIKQLFRIRDEAEKVLRNNQEVRPETRNLVNAAMKVKEAANNEFRRIEGVVGKSGTIENYKIASDLESAISRTVKGSSQKEKMQNVLDLADVYNSGQNPIVALRQSLKGILGDEAEKELADKMVLVNTLRTVSDDEILRKAATGSLPEAAAVAAKFGTYSAGGGAAKALAAGGLAKRALNYVGLEGEGLLKRTKQLQSLNEIMRKSGSGASKYAPLSYPVSNVATDKDN